MPSECYWVFYWLYSKAMPTLLGRIYLAKTIISLADGNVTTSMAPLRTGLKKGLLICPITVFADSMYWIVLK
jgi:hypothetical protein